MRDGIYVEETWRGGCGYIETVPQQECVWSD